MFTNQELERRMLNEPILNQLKDLGIEIKELRKENSSQFKYIVEHMSSCNENNLKKFVLTGTFWKVVSTLFVLVCGSYTYIASLHNIKI